MQTKGTIYSGLVMLVAFAGCSNGSPSTLTPSTVIMPTSVARIRVGAAATVVPSDYRASTMRPEATRTKLLYISNSGANDVTVYSYPAYTFEGILHGFNEPQGVCGDRSGDVWIVNTGGSQVVEYAHGGSTPIAIVSETGYYPAGCAVDPTTGNLAVTNITAASGNPGNIAIFAHGQASPKYYMLSSNISRPVFCAYDHNGNLFVDGNTVGTGGFGFAELRKNTRKFRVVWLTKSLGFPGGMQWNGKSLLVGDQDTNTVYQVNVAGQSGKVVGSTVLSGAKDVAGFWDRGDRIIGADLAASTAPVWKFPAGGTATQTVTYGVYQPVGAIISEAPLH
jgi:hypothetical protein